MGCLFSYFENENENENEEYDNKIIFNQDSYTNYYSTDDEDLPGYSESVYHRRSCD